MEILSNLKNYLIIVLFCLVSHSTTCIAAQPVAFQQDSLLNQPAPHFKLTDVNGKTYEIAALKGKIVVLNFWFIACHPCVAEMDRLNVIKNSYDPTKVVFLALSVDGTEALKIFLRTHNFEYHIVPNATQVANQYQIYAYPTSMVIDKKGIIRFIQAGGPAIETHLPAAINSVM